MLIYILTYSFNILTKIGNRESGFKTTIVSFTETTTFTMQHLDQILSRWAKGDGRRWACKLSRFEY